MESTQHPHGPMGGRAVGFARFWRRKNPAQSVRHVFGATRIFRRMLKIAAIVRNGTGVRE
ncbi:hypothetical protein ABIE09_004527 [Lysobacter enzymogenes]|uniref:hypothetical protein n=1 Tax=Lysobacter enzymogenes TaxID=69 RepID=UPI0033986345